MYVCVFVCMYLGLCMYKVFLFFGFVELYGCVSFTAPFVSFSSYSLFLSFLELHISKQLICSTFSLVLNF